MVVMEPEFGEDIGSKEKPSKEFFNELALNKPKYTHVQEVESNMREDDYEAAMRAMVEKEERREQALRNPPVTADKRINDEYTELTVHKLQDRIGLLEDANAALQRKYPDEKMLNDFNRRESRTKLSNLLS